MDSINPEDVVRVLRSPVPRVRTGLILVPTQKINNVVNEAVRLGIEHIDARKCWIDKLPHGTKYAGITTKKLILLLDEIVNKYNLNDCVLLYNFDVLISFLKYEDRKSFWTYLINYMPHRACAILIAIPYSNKTDELLPNQNQLDFLRQEKRISIFP